MGNIGRTTLIMIAFGLVTYTVSFFGYLYPIINLVSFWIALTAVIYFSFKSIHAGVLIVIMELVLGNKGYLFSNTIFGHFVSLRQAIFVIILAATAFHIMTNRKIVFWKSTYRWWFISFLIFVVFGIINGFIRNDHTIWFYDLNAYIFCLLILPFSEGIVTRRQVERATIWLAGGSMTLAIITILVAGIFGTVYYRPGFINATQIDDAQLAKLSENATAPENARLGQATQPRISQYHLNWADISPERPIVYRWLRDTGTAETAYLGGRIFRVFFSSHLYLLAGLFIGIALLAKIDHWWRSRKFWMTASGLLFISVATVISFSRSLWLGAIAGLIITFVSIGKRSALRIGGLALASIAMIFITTMVIVPSLSKAITERFQATASPTTEVAASNRLQLLPAVIDQLKSRPILGSGFGTTVTYRTIVAGTDQLEFVRVYLYEWAYLDIAVKIGILGVIAYLIFLVKIVYNTWLARVNGSALNKIVATGLLGLITCIIIANVFTPYLNHPLGIGAILFIAVVSEVLVRNPSQYDAKG